MKNIFISMAVIIAMSLLTLSCNNEKKEKLDLCKCLNSTDGEWNSKHFDECNKAVKDYFKHNPSTQELLEYSNKNCNK